VQDALYPGNLEKTSEFKAAGSNMAMYVSSVASIHHSCRDVVGKDEVDSDLSEQSKYSFNAIARVIKEMFDFTLLKSFTFIFISLSGIFGFLGM
jgi:hypothetical protein